MSVLAAQACFLTQPTCDLQIPAVADPRSAQDGPDQDAGPASISQAEEDATHDARDKELYGSGGSMEEEDMARTGADPRLVLLWEWQCPVPASLTLSTRVTCMAWNKVLQQNAVLVSTLPDQWNELSNQALLLFRHCSIDTVAAAETPSDPSHLHTASN